MTKPEGVVRIVVLGGSSAFDIYALEGRDWPALVEKRLHHLGFKDVEVINAAVPGNATWDSLGRFYAEIWMFQPDYVLFYGAWNDIKYFAWLNPEMSLLRRYRPKVSMRVSGRSTLMVRNPFLYHTGPLDRFLCNSQLYNRLRFRFWSWRIGKVPLEGMATAQTKLHSDYGPWGPRQYKLNVSLLVEAARAIGAVPVLLTQARLLSDAETPLEGEQINYYAVGLSHDALFRAFEACDAALFEVSKEKNLDVIDVATMFSGQEKMFADGVHTTAVGSEAISRPVADHLARLLASPPGAHPPQ
jgi:hypothetical protein